MHDIKSMGVAQSILLPKGFNMQRVNDTGRTGQPLGRSNAKQRMCKEG